MSEFVGLLDDVERNATHEADFSLMRLGCLGKDVAASLASNTSVTSLNLTDTKLGCDGSKAVALALSVNTTLTDLNMQFNALGDDGVRALSKGLIHNEGLKSLDLQHNYVQSRGARALAASLARNTILRTLDMSHNPLGDAGVGLLARALRKNSHLQTLHLRQVGLGDGGCTALAEALHKNNSLSCLDLEKNFITQIGGDALANVLHHNQTLRSLNLARNQLGIFTAESFAKALFHNTSLVELNLAGDTAFGFYFEKRTNIGLYGVIALRSALKSATLTSLDLGGNDINPIGASCIAEFLTLNQCLTHINLSYNKIGSRGAKMLANALRSNQYVSSIHLEQNNIGVSGAKHLANMLTVNSCIRELNVSWNPLDLEGTLALAYTLRSNTTLHRINIAQCVTRTSTVTQTADALRLLVKELNAASSVEANKSCVPTLLELASRQVLQHSLNDRLNYELILPDDLADMLNDHCPCLVCASPLLQSPITACKITEGVIVRSKVCSPSCFHVLFPRSVLVDIAPRVHVTVNTGSGHHQELQHDDSLSSSSGDFDTDLSDLSDTDGDLELSEDESVYRYMRCRVCNKSVHVAVSGNRGERRITPVVCSRECAATIVQYEGSFQRRPSPISVPDYHRPDSPSRSSLMLQSPFASASTGAGAVSVPVPSHGITSPLSPLHGQHWSDDEDALLTLSDDDVVSSRASLLSGAHSVEVESRSMSLQ